MGNNNFPLLRAMDIKKHFGEGQNRVDVLQGLSFQLFEGEKIAVIGASGVGKSTLLHILGTLDIPDSGKVYFKNQDIFKMDEKTLATFRNRHIGFVFQFHYLLPEFDPLENIMIPELMAGTPRNLAKEKALVLLEKVGLSRHIGQRVSTLSGGERQRVAVARALIRGPQLLLADEPTGNLDTKTSARIHELLVDLNEKEKISMVVATHNLELAALMDKVYRLKDGILIKTEVSLY
ncbi:MAG TPA: ABC transporter ATP-binding protein [Deltaproteobacteria bacterium]|nr:ABC transporter ATP-binding protein [Deltaproteobacteria bacterium]